MLRANQQNSPEECPPSFISHLALKVSEARSGRRAGGAGRWRWRRMRLTAPCGGRRGVGVGVGLPAAAAAQNDDSGAFLDAIDAAKRFNPQLGIVIAPKGKTYLSRALEIEGARNIALCIEVRTNTASVGERAPIHC